MNNEYIQFLTSNTIDSREYRTIEISHSQFTKTYRFVKDYVNQEFLVDGNILEFAALSMNIVEPSENIDAEQVLTIELGAVGSNVNSEIQNISGYGVFEPVRVIYRKYYSGTTTIEYTLDLSCTSIVFNSYSSVTLTCEDLDINNKSSGEIYTLDRFQGLRGL